MPIAVVTAMGTGRKMLGFSRNTLEFESGTVADLLQQLPTHDRGGRSDRPVSNGRSPCAYAIAACEFESRLVGQKTARSRRSRHHDDHSSPGWRLANIAS
jgi:hypothetical protein